MARLKPALAMGSLLAAAGAVAQPPAPPASQIELGGARIGEERTSIEKRFGKPTHAGTMPDGLEYWVYGIDDGSRTQLIVTFETFRRDFTYGVQVTGGRSAKVPAFLGVNLGDTRAVLDAKLGPPTEVKAVKDPAVADVGLSMLTYAGRNYTAEVNKDERVYSIRINGYEGWLESLGWAKNWDNYRPWSLQRGLDGTGKPDVPGVAERWISLDARMLPIRPRVIYRGDKKTLTAAEGKLLAHAFDARQLNPELLKQFVYTVRVSESGTDYRVAVQEPLFAHLDKEVPVGTPVDLFALVIGRSSDVPGGLFIVNEFQTY